MIEGEEGEGSTGASRALPAASGRGRGASVGAAASAAPTGATLLYPGSRLDALMGPLTPSTADSASLLIGERISICHGLLVYHMCN